MTKNIKNNVNKSNNNSDFDYEDFKKSAIKKLYEGKGILGKEGAFTPLIKEFLEIALKEELKSHLNQEKDLLDEDFSNKRNGNYSKIVKTDSDQFDIEVPRDRNASFNPEIVKKRQSVLTEDLDKKIIGLYGLGMSYSSISRHIKELYDIDVSTSTITNITDKIVPKITEFNLRKIDFPGLDLTIP